MCRSTRSVRKGWRAERYRPGTRGDRPTGAAATAAAALPARRTPRPKNRRPGVCAPLVRIISLARLGKQRRRPRPAKYKLYAALLYEACIPRGYGVG